jgi:hypothetical protein
MDPNLAPQDLPLRVIALVTGLSILGGLANFIGRLRQGTLRVHWFIELSGDVLYSLSAGFTVWYLAISTGMCEYSSAAMAIVAGHLGARLMFALQNAAIDRALGWLDGKKGNQSPGGTD